MTTTATCSIAVTTGIATVSGISAGGVIQPGATVTGPGASNVSLVSTTGIIATGGTSLTAGTYTGVSITGGSGSGMKATVVVAGGVASSITITTPGGGYIDADVLSMAVASIGGVGTAPTFSVQWVVAAPIVIQPYGTGGTTGTGGNGTYATNISTAVASATLTFTLVEPPVNTQQLQGVPLTPPAWSSIVNYLGPNPLTGFIGSVVASGGLFYVAVAPSLNQAPPNATYWTVLYEAVPEVEYSTLTVPAIRNGSSIIPPAPLPSGTANTSVGVPI